MVHVYREKDEVEILRGEHDGKVVKVKFVTDHGFLLLDLGNGSDVYCRPEDVRPA